MISQAKRLHLRLFLEGQEVPVIAAVVNGGVGTPASSSIQVVPTDAVMRLLPRTLVHLFFFDLYPDDAALEALNEATEHGYQGISINFQTVLTDGYKLLFAGELHSYMFQKSPAGRSITLQCLDFSSYWDSAKQYYAQGETSSDVAKLAAFVGAGNTKVSESGATAELLKILTSRPVTYPQVDGLLGGILHLIESIGGIYKGTKGFRGINDFFSAAELRLKISQTLGASAQDTSSKRLFQHKSFRPWLRHTLARNRGIVSFRDILDILLGRIYHEYVSIPAPAYREKFKTTITKSVPGKSRLPKHLADALQGRVAQLDAFAANFTMGTGETLEGYGIRKNLLAGFFEATVTGDSSLRGRIGSISDQIYDRKLGKPDRATGADLEFVNQVSVNSAVAADHARVASKNYKKLMAARSVITRSEVVSLDRLIMQVFRPNIFFAPPPRCNVLFPDQYTSLTYRRSFMQEVTRLQVKTQKEWGQDASTTMEGGSKKTYWAPGTQDVEGTLMCLSAKKGTRFLMPHEIYTGIIPQIEHEADIVAFQKIDRQHGGRNQIPYMQRFTNYKFFLQRFGPRTLTLSGPFNPYVVPGFPALVVDRYFPDSVQDSLNLQPTQYLGSIMSVSHSLNQSGQGTTNIQMAYCRTHDEELEEGTYEHLVTEIVGMATKVVPVLATVGWAVDQGSLTVENVEIVRNTKTKAHIVSGNPEKLVGKGIHGLGKIVGVTPDPGLLAVKSIDPRTGQSPSARHTADGVTTWVKVQRHLTRKRSVKVAPERALYPGWMSPIYTNINIGRAFYMEMFGIGSICDPVQLGVTDMDITSQGLPFLPDTVGVADANALAQEKLEEFKKGTLAVLKDNVAEFIGELGFGESLTHALASEVSAEVHLGASIQEAIDALVGTYRAIKENGYDIDDFLGRYTRRPVATLRDILGPPNYVPAGNAEQFGVSAAMFGKTSQAGFHSNAFGPYDRMVYLDHPILPRINRKGEYRKIDGAADPRKERYRRVMEYCLSLQDKGLRG